MDNQLLHQTDNFQWIIDGSSYAVAVKKMKREREEIYFIETLFGILKATDLSFA
jgi:hypothetical protein